MLTRIVPIYIESSSSLMDELLKSAENADIDNITDAGIDSLRQWRDRDRRRKTDHCGFSDQFAGSGVCGVELAGVRTAGTLWRRKVRVSVSYGGVV